MAQLDLNTSQLEQLLAVLLAARVTVTSITSGGVKLQVDKIGVGQKAPQPCERVRRSVGLIPPSQVKDMALQLRKALGAANFRKIVGGQAVVSVVQS